MTQADLAQLAASRPAELWIEQANYLRTRDLPRALEAANMAVIAAVGHRNAELLDARARQIRGRIYSTLGRYEEALEDAVRAQQCFIGRGDRTGSAVQSFLIGTVYLNQGLYADALVLYVRAVEELEISGDKDWLVRALNNLGYTHIYMESPALAVAPISRAVELSRALGDDFSLSLALDSLALAQLDLGRHNEALANALEGSRLLHDSGLSLLDYLADYHITVGRANMGLGRLAEAEHHFAAAQDTARRGGFGSIEASACQQQGRLALLQQQPERARRLLLQAIDTAQTAGDSRLVCQIERDLALHYKQQGEHLLALTHLENYQREMSALQREEADIRLRNTEIRYRVLQHDKGKAHFGRVSQALDTQINARRDAHRKLMDDQHMDALTGLLPRRHFWSQARARLDNAPGYTVALLDIDRFGACNARLGDAGGDLLLAGIAQHLKNALPPQALCCRYGGDEFLLLLPGQDREQATALLSPLLAANLKLGDDYQMLTLGAGLCTQGCDTPLASAVDQAEQALMRAKARGPGQMEAG